MTEMRGFLGGLEPAFQCWDDTTGDISPGSSFLTQRQVSQIAQNLKTNLLDTVLLLELENNGLDNAQQEIHRKQAFENLESAYNSKTSKNYMSQNTFIGNYTSIKDSEKKNFDISGQNPTSNYPIPASTNSKQLNHLANKENENSLNQNLIVEPKILFQNTLVPTEIGHQAVINSRGISKDSKSR